MQQKIEMCTSDIHMTDIAEQHTQTSCKEIHDTNFVKVVLAVKVYMVQHDKLRSGYTTRRSRHYYTRTHEGGEYSEVVLCKVVHTPQKKTQPNPFKDKALSTSQKNASLSCVGFAHRTPSPKTAANQPCCPMYRRASIKRSTGIYTIQAHYRKYMYIYL